MTPHSSLMKSDKHFNKGMNISSHLIFGAVLPASKAQAMLACTFTDLRDSTPEPLTAAAFVSRFCLLSCSDIRLFFLSAFTFSQTFLLSKREAVIAWYQGVAHHCQESQLCCVPRGHIGFKCKLWERKKGWTEQGISAKAEVSCSDGEEAEIDHLQKKKRKKENGGEKEQRRKTNPIILWSEYVKLNKEADLNTPSYCPREVWIFPAIRGIGPIAVISRPFPPFLLPLQPSSVKYSLFR